MSTKNRLCAFVRMHGNYSWTFTFGEGKYCKELLPPPMFFSVCSLFDLDSFLFCFCYILCLQGTTLVRCLILRQGLCASPFPFWCGLSREWHLYLSTKHSPLLTYYIPFFSSFLFCHFSKYSKRDKVKIKETASFDGYE